MQNATPTFWLEPDSAFSPVADGECCSGPLRAVQEIHILFAGVSGQSARNAADSCPPPAGFASLPVPVGPSQLLRHAHRAEGQPHAEPSPKMLATLEAVRTKHRQLRLLVVQSAPYTLKLNGLPASKVVVAKEKDFLQWDEGPAFHISIFRKPFVGRPPSELLNKECSICRTPFSPDSKIFICPECHGGLHCEDDREGGLECALLRANRRCPSCGHDIRLKSGYGYHPEVDNV